MRYLDANIFIYVINDHPKFGSLSKKILSRINTRESALITTLTLSEVIWFFEKEGIKDLKSILEKIRSIKNLEIITLDFELMWQASNISNKYHIDFNDSVTVSAMLTHNITEIYSNDTDFDSINFIKRIFG